jgi:hypothetical protein
MAARKPKLLYSIFCDDIRQETGSKLSFMGVYGPDGVYIPRKPFIFPMFCAALSFKNIKGGDSFEVSLISPSGKKIGKGIHGSIPDEEKIMHGFLILAKFVPMKVDEEGTYKIETIFNDEVSTKQVVEIPIQLRK